VNKKNILTVYRRDIGSIFTNPVALIITLGIAVLPALYAWVNIEACWNPYNNTGNIPVAVVNNDQHINFQNKQISIGAQVVQNLQKNHNIKWIFVNEKYADLGLIDGTYYAEIQIPANFSSSFISFLSNNVKKPQIIYKVNTKVNPVANKITDTAANTLVDQISTSFVTTVDQTVYSYLNGVGANAANNKNNILNFKDDIIAINKNMDVITSSLQMINERSANLNEFLTQLRATMPDIDTGLSNIISANQSGQQAVRSTQQTMNASFDNLAVYLSNTKAEAQRIDTMLTELNSSASDATASQTNATIAQISMDLTTLSDEVANITSYLQTLDQAMPNATITHLVADLQSLQDFLNEEKSNLSSLQQQMLKTNTLNKQLLGTIIAQANGTCNDLIDAVSQYNTQVRPELNNAANGLYAAMGDATQIISTAQGLNQQIDSLLKNASDGSALASQVSGDLKARLLQYQGIISELGNKLEAIDNSDILQIITVLQNNPALMGNFLSSPFNLKEESIYPIPNYGSAMAPIYTVLALWVGTLILTSILKTEPPEFPGSVFIGQREQFYGKMLTFLTISVTQALITTLGNKLFLGVYTVNFPLMIVVVVVSSITFTMITFTLVALFGNIGKAISIIYLIIQIAGSGGSYPIQVDPLFFRILQPLFPFTYSLEGLREAIGGPVIERVLVDFIALFIMQALALLFGYLLRIPLYDSMRRFGEKFEEAGIGE
jgi:YhgE/Pip N-terminal domain/YhgE/Pip C-terminal domain